MAAARPSLRWAPNIFTRGDDEGDPVSSRRAIKVTVMSKAAVPTVSQPPTSASNQIKSIWNPPAMTRETRSVPRLADGLGAQPLNILALDLYGEVRSSRSIAVQYSLCLWSCSLFSHRPAPGPRLQCAVPARPWLFCCGALWVDRLLVRGQQ